MFLINVTPGDLEAFLSVADAGSFRGGAATIGLSQPAVSARINHLEAVLGTRLFDRTTRRVTITESGERLRQRVEHMMGELRALAREFNDEAKLKRGRLNLGASPSVAATFLPGIIRRFQQRWPAVELVLHDDFFGRALDRLTRGEVDMAIIPFEPDQPAFHFEQLISDDFLIALPTTHPFARRQALSMNDIATLPLITMPPQSATWASIRRAFISAGLEFRPAVQTRNTLTSLAMVRAGLGVALVTRILSEVLDMDGVATLPVLSEHLTRHVGIVTSPDRSPSPAARAMSTLLRDFATSRAR